MFAKEGQYLAHVRVSGLTINTILKDVVFQMCMAV